MYNDKTTMVIIDTHLRLMRKTHEHYLSFQNRAIIIWFHNTIPTSNRRYETR